MGVFCLVQDPIGFALVKTNNDGNRPGRDDAKLRGVSAVNSRTRGISRSGLQNLTAKGKYFHATSNSRSHFCCLHSEVPPPNQQGASTGSEAAVGELTLLPRILQCNAAVQGCRPQRGDQFVLPNSVQWPARLPTFKYSNPVWHPAWRPERHGGPK